MEIQANASAAAEPALEIKRVFAAPRELVWRAWTDPRQLAQWWGPRCFDNPVCELDLRPGGSLRIEMRAPDGTIYPMTGVYQEIDAPARLVFTSAALDESGQPVLEVLTTLTFEDQGGQTLLTMTAKVISVTAVGRQCLAGMEEGWNQTLDKLVEYMQLQLRRP